LALTLMIEQTLGWWFGLPQNERVWHPRRSATRRTAGAR